MSAEASLKSRITDDMKTAMRAGDKERLGTIRLMLAAIKQVEVDTRNTPDDAAILGILDKMVKQRRESIVQYEKAGREELAAREYAEIEVIQSYLPSQLSSAEIDTLIDAAISETGAQSIRDMGKVMGQLKPKLQGRADIGAVSTLIKQRLNS
jgi:uncharacterized protein YqeY